MYTFDSKVRYSETDTEGKLSVKALVNYLQDCSTFQSSEIGYGVDYLFPRGLAWVVSFWQIDIIKYPRLCDRITIGTMPYMFKGFIGYRNFYMKDEKDEYLVKATSIWTLLDMTTGRPTRPTEEHVKAYPVEEKLDMEYLSRKIAIPEKLRRCEDIEIKKYHLDTNQHVNNGQFIAMATDQLENERDVTRIRVEYKRQAHLGDILIPYIGDIDDGRCVVVLKNTDNEDVCVVEL